MFIQLLLSSQLFLPSIWYAYITQQRILLFSFTMSYLGSTQYYINYERDELYHGIDLVTARTGAMIDFFYTLYYIKPYYLSIVLIHNVTLTYLLSNIFYYYKEPIWLTMHIYFHIWISITCFLITCEGNRQSIISKTHKQNFFLKSKTNSFR